MKRIIYFIVAAVVLMGCEDFLEQKPLTQKTSDNYPQTADDADQMMAGIYTTMNNAQRFADRSYFFICEVASDDKLGGGGSGDVAAQSYETFQYDNSEMLIHAWEQTYTGIHRANYAIENIDLISDEVVSPAVKDQYKGEALFLRAWFYYKLATIFGEVPLKITTEAVNLPAASSEELYGQMAADLKTAIGLLPNVSYQETTEGRVTKWAAEALMARVFLFYTGFYNQDAITLPDGSSVTNQNVTTWLADCIDNSGHDLVDDFHELWPYTNSATIGDYEYIQNYMAETGKSLTYANEGGARSPETVFALKFSYFSDWGVKRGYSNQYQLYFALRGLQPLDNTFPFAGGWGQGNSVPEVLVEQWQADEPNDPRLWASVMDINKEVMDSTVNEDYDFEDPDSEPYIQTGYKRGQWDFVMESNYWGKKYNGVTAKNGDGEVMHDYSVVVAGNSNNSQLSHNDDLVYIRFADVLLMMSELTEDAQYMNQVRARADLPATTYSPENLRKERRYELAFEGLRWNDMRRWGDAYAKTALQSQVGAPIFNFGSPAVHQPLHSAGYDGRYDATKGFFPIPQSQIDLSEGLLQQVEGYRDGNGLYSGWGS